MYRTQTQTRIKCQCVSRPQTGTPYRCVWGKDRGRVIPVFIMDKIHVFTMDRQGHPTGVHGAKTEAGKYLCLSWTKYRCLSWTQTGTPYRCVWGKERGTDILVCIHVTRSRTEKGKYQCPSDKDKGKWITDLSTLKRKEIPVDYDLSTPD